MQPLAVVGGFDKGSDRASGLAQIAIAASTNFFLLQSFHEVFGLGVVVRVADTAHTGLDVVHRQDFRVFVARILDTPIGMMDQTASFWLPCRDRQRRNGQLRPQMRIQRPADNLAG